MATNFVEVDLEGIEQGAFLEAIRKGFEEFSHKIVNCAISQEEAGQTGKISGKLVATVEVQYKDKGFMIGTSVEMKMPNKVRSGASMAFQADDIQGEPCLFAKASGTDRTHPKQNVLCDDDGGELTDQH